MSDRFPFVIRERVRFRDLDSSGHVNNSVYANYVEEARVAIFGKGAGFILGRLEIDFRAQTHIGQDVEVQTRFGRLGTKSVELEHRVAADGRLVAEARSVVVAYDRATGESVPVPDEWRTRIAAAAGVA